MTGAGAGATGAGAGVTGAGNGLLQLYDQFRDVTVRIPRQLVNVPDGKAAEFGGFQN